MPQYVGFRAVLSHFPFQYLQNFIAPHRLGHVDEIDDDDAADITEPQLPGDFHGRFLIDVKYRILQGAVARVLAAVDIDDRQCLRMVEDQRASRRQRDFTGHECRSSSSKL